MTPPVLVLAAAWFCFVAMWGVVIQSRLKEQRRELERDRKELVRLGEKLLAEAWHLSSRLGVLTVRVDDAIAQAVVTLGRGEIQ